MRSDRLVLAIALWTTGCIGVYAGHAPPTPYPITEQDLVEPPPPALEGPPLGARFEVPRLVSLAPDPVAVAYTSGRQVQEFQMARQSVPPAFDRGFTSAAGGTEGAELPVTVVLDRLLYTCWPVVIGRFPPGERLFVEATVQFGDLSDRVRFTLPGDGVCWTDKPRLMRAGGTALAAEVARLSEQVR